MARTTVRTHGADVHAAVGLAERLGLPLDDPDVELELAVTPERLELRLSGPGAPGPIYADFVTGSGGYRGARATRGDGIARAVGLKGTKVPSVLDATAGLGRDAFMLASLGASVTLVERSAVVAALLEDALARASVDPRTHEAAARMRLVHADARAYLAELGNEARPDVVYLDPMYPESGKNALKNKEMRAFRLLVGDDADVPELLDAALTAARERVVVKRPRKARPLAGRPPTAAIPGTTTRFDVYVAGR